MRASRIVGIRSKVVTGEWFGSESSQVHGPSQIKANDVADEILLFVCSCCGDVWPQISGRS